MAKPVKASGGGKGGKGTGAKGMFSAVPGAFGLNDISMTDPQVQQALMRSQQGIQEGVEGQMQGLEDLAGRTGGSSGGLQAAMQRMMLQGEQMKAEQRGGAEQDILKAGWDREAQRAQLIEDLRKGQIAASAQRYSADQSRIGQLGAARIGVGPEYARLNFQKDMAPLEFLQAMQPYNVYHPEMQQGGQQVTQPGWGAALGGAAATGIGQGISGGWGGAKKTPGGTWL
jgi:hypothetical protein